MFRNLFHYTQIRHICPRQMVKIYLSTQYIMHILYEFDIFKIFSFIWAKSKCIQLTEVKINLILEYKRSSYWQLQGHVKTLVETNHTANVLDLAGNVLGSNCKYYKVWQGYISLFARGHKETVEGKNWQYVSTYKIKDTIKNVLCKAT